MKQSKILFLAVVLFTFVPSNGQNKEKIEYLTLANATLHKTQADTLKALHKKIFFINNEIKKIEYRINRAATSAVSILEYYLEDKEDKELIKKKYPECSFIFKMVKKVDSFKIVTTETYENFVINSPVPNSLNKNNSEQTVFNNKNQIIAFEGFINNKVEKERYKILYNKKGISILVCDFLRKTYSVFKDDDYLDLNRQPIETFNFNEFNKLKEKYFTNQDISYYENAELIPTNDFITKYTTTDSTKKATYLTEIGTEISENKLQKVANYARVKYTKNQIKEIEFFDNKKVSIDYYLDKNEDIEIVSKNLKQKYQNYTLVASEQSNKNYLKQTYYLYENGTLTDKIRKIKNQEDLLIGIEYYSKKDLTKLDKSLAIKRYYDKNNKLVFECHYNNKGNCSLILLFLKPDALLNEPMRIDVFENKSKFNNFKNNYFPNEEIEYYRTAEL